MQQELELVGELEPTAAQGPIVEGQIADLAVYEGFAYLMSWDEPSCTKGGTYIADIRDPANPQEIGFLPAADGYYHGEGAHVVSLNTPAFTGDLLAVNDEACSNDATRPADVPNTAGGFDLYDVTDPTNPVTLGQNFGDKTPDGSLDPDPDPARLANSYHSVFVWQDGPRAYLVGVDNTEFADVDIYDITDPSNPEFINDLDLFTLPEYDQIVSEGALGENVFNHDMVVKRIDGRMVMMVSYWDGGYVQLDVTDPANATYITDTNFDDPDPLTGFDPPEGNAHQGEFSHDNQFLLTGEEDFAPDRVDRVEIDDRTEPRRAPGSAIGGSAPASILEDGALNGPTYYGGYGCPASAPVPDRDAINPTLDPGEEAILVLQRGPGSTDDPPVPDDPEAPEEAASRARRPRTRSTQAGMRSCSSTATAAAATRTAVPAGSARWSSRSARRTRRCTCCSTIRSAQASQSPIRRVTTRRSAPPARRSSPSRSSTAGVTRTSGTRRRARSSTRSRSPSRSTSASPRASATSRSTSSRPTRPRTSPTAPTTRAGSVSSSSTATIGLTQTGAYIDDEGSNFWGIEQFTTPGGERLIAGSDRDFGLQIFRYTGPGAAQPPSCSATTATTAPGVPVSVPLTCTDPNGNPLTRDDRGTAGQRHARADRRRGSVLYTPGSGLTSGADTFQFAASDGAATSAAATATIDVSAGNGRRAGDDDHEEAEEGDDQAQGEVQVHLECARARASSASSTRARSRPASRPSRRGSTPAGTSSRCARPPRARST